MPGRNGITRRDFLNGFALTLGVGATVAPADLLARAGRKSSAGRLAEYPPLKTGMRGNHPGSFEVAHALACNGMKFAPPRNLTDTPYDLVVVGAGISGLAAADFYRERSGGDARILLLDNHDDFGGHAKRNEFVVDGKTIIGYGGSQSIDTPGQYSPVAKKLLRDLSIDVSRFYDYFDQNFSARHGLRKGVYFSKTAYGTDRIALNVVHAWGVEPSPDEIRAAVPTYPLSESSRSALLRLMTEDRDYLEHLGKKEKTELLRRTSYSNYLRDRVGVTDEVVALFESIPRAIWGIGWDALSALEAYRMGQPGVQHLGLGRPEGDPPEADEPYIFHFPDGNAGIARALVRRLIPDALTGNTMEDLVISRLDYGLLDTTDSPIRLRLESTAVDVRHSQGGKSVDVTYVTGGDVHRVRANHVILACYNAIVPHLCTEIRQQQIDALAYATKVPLVYISVALRNWKAFANVGYDSFYIPEAKLMSRFGLDFPVSIGEYRFTNDPAQPTMVHGQYVPTEPGRGLTARQQHKIGRQRLYEMSFAQFEENIIEQMDGALGSGGFDAERDIAAITVNRWPHGYAYEYNDYSDPADWGPDRGPHIAGRERIGRISIANSDASAYAYVDGAIDAADRAVNEQLG